MKSLIVESNKKNLKIVVSAIFLFFEQTILALSPSYNGSFDISSLTKKYFQLPYERFYLSSLFGETSNPTTPTQIHLQSGDVRYNAPSYGCNFGFRFLAFASIEGAFLKVANLRILDMNGLGVEGRIAQNFPSLGMRFYLPLYQNLIDVSFLGGAGLLMQTPSYTVQRYVSPSYLQRPQEMHLRPYWNIEAHYNGFNHFGLAMGFQYILPHRTSQHILFPYVSLKIRLFSEEL